MTYKKVCSLCRGNGYITIEVEGKDEIKQCWLCESSGEKEYSDMNNFFIIVFASLGLLTLLSIYILVAVL